MSSKTLLNLKTNIEKANYGLVIELTSKITLKIPTMLFNDNTNVVKFLIPLYEDNNDKFYPADLSSNYKNAEYDYCDYGFLIISNAKSLMDLLTKGKTKVDGFVGNYTHKDELKNYIKQEKIEIILID